MHSLAETLSGDSQHGMRTLLCYVRVRQRMAEPAYLEQPKQGLHLVAC